MLRIHAVAIAAGSLVAVAAHAQNAPPANVENIVVTASPLTTDPDKLATIAGAATRDDILRNGGASLSDALANVPGVTGSGFAPGASRPVIRGFDSNRVRLLEDGIGGGDVSEIGPDHGVPIDPMAAQRIEVVRGAATLRYGSQAIGGVVNALNNRVPLALPLKTVNGELDAAYESGARAGQGGAMIDARAGDYALHADAFGRRAEDYDIPGGQQLNSFFEGKGFSGGGSYFFGGSRVGAALIHYDAHYGIPAGDTFIDMRQTKGLVRSSFALDAGAAQTLSIDGGYADYRHDEIDPAGNTILATFLNREWDTRAELMLGQLGPFSRSAVGAQFQHREFSAAGEATDYLSPATGRNAAAFLFTEVPLTSAVSFQAAGRIESARVSGTPATAVPTVRGFTPVSGSASVLVTPYEGLNLGLTVSSAARAPNMPELFARGPHDGPLTFETGDPTLKIERSNAIEGTLHASVARAHLEASVWGAKFNNYIYGRLTGRTCDGEGTCVAGGTEELKELLYEQHDARFWGFEAKASVDVAQWDRWSLSANVFGDYVRATLDNLGDVPRIPPYHVGAGATLASDAVEIGVTIKHAGAQNRIGAGDTSTAGFENVDAYVMLRPTADGRVELGLIGRNLTNSIQRNAVSFNKDDVVRSGRDLRLVLRARF